MKPEQDIECDQLMNVHQLAVLHGQRGQMYHHVRHSQMLQNVKMYISTNITSGWTGQAGQPVRLQHGYLI